MEITKLFGKHLKYYREKKGLSQESLAHLCNLHRTYIGSVERGERNITLISAKKIAEALEIKLCQLIEEEEENNEYSK